MFLAELEGKLLCGTVQFEADLSNANANLYRAECVAWHTDAIV